MQSLVQHSCIGGAGVGIGGTGVGIGGTASSAPAGWDPNVVPTSLEEVLVSRAGSTDRLTHTVLPHVGGPAYPPDGAEHHTTPGSKAFTVLPHEGGPAYPPDGAETTTTPGSKAFTVLPHVGGEDWANHKAVRSPCQG